MDVLFTDWFIYNITEYINISDLNRLRFVNKYYYKEITLKYLCDTVDKKIAERKKVEDIGYAISNEQDSLNFTRNDGFPLEVPNNTMWEFDIKVTPLNYGIVAEISGSIKNVLGKIIESSVSYGRWGNVLKLSCEGEIITPTIIVEYMGREWTGTINIKAISF
jgi:hypothetical protein